MPIVVEREKASLIELQTKWKLQRKADKKAPEIDAYEQPGLWMERVLNSHLYPKQVRMVEALRSYDQVSVAGCNSSGKDWTAARIALWWMKIHEGQPAKVVITGPTFRQIQQVVWQELRTAYLYGADALGGHLYESPYCRWDEQRFIVGFSTDKPYQLQGYHSPNLLIIVTEAHGVAQSHMDVLWRLNPNKMLLTGNPISESGEFYDSHHGKSHLWHTINIDAFDTPNVIEGREVVPGLVTREDIERHKRNWGEESPLYRMTVLNEWVEGMGSLVVVPLSWAKAAEAAEHIPGPIEVVACDIAEYGTDETVIVSRRGRVVRVLMRIQGQDLMQTTGYIKAYHDAHKHAHIIVDGVGVGAGVVSRLRELNVGVIRFMGGESASDSSQYENLNAEVWWRMREGYAKGLDVEEDSLLRSEVSSRKYIIQSDKRIKLESKKDMRKAGRKSPDTCLVAGTMVLTNKGEVPIERIKPGMQVLTRQGYQKVVAARMTISTAPVVRVALSNGRALIGTPDHPVWTDNRGFVCLDTLTMYDILRPYTIEARSISEWLSRILFIGTGSCLCGGQSLHDGICGITTGLTTRIQESALKVLALFIVRFGRHATAQYRSTASFITRIVIPSTTSREIWNALRPKSTCRSILLSNQRSCSDRGGLRQLIWLGFGMVVLRGCNGTLRMARQFGLSARRLNGFVLNAVTNMNLCADGIAISFVPRTVETATATVNDGISKSVNVGIVGRSLWATGREINDSVPVRVLSVTDAGTASVYNLQVERANEFFANGVLVHNSDAVAMSFMVDYQIDGDRLTAGSNLDDRENAVPAMQGFGNLYDRPSADALRRGSDMAPNTGSRWDRVRKGYRR